MEHKREILLRLPQLEKVVGMKRTTIYKRMAAGTFPRPVRLGANSVAWKSGTVQEWIDSLQVTP